MEAMLNNLIKAVGWSILHSLWQGAIIYGILFISFMVWTKMSARLKHNLAFSALFLMFVSFCFTFFSLFEFPSANSTGHLLLNESAYQDLVSKSSSFSLKTEAYFPIVACIYSLGIIFQLVVLLSGYFKLKKLKQNNNVVVPAEWTVIFESTLHQLKINKTVKFFLSAKVNVPLVIGFFKPVVLFPVALATQLDLKQVEAILLHELSHVRRNDYLINLVKTCIETLLFFNPFVWLTTRFIQIEREHACDDLVVKFTGTPLTYAHALLKLELLKEKQVPALSLAATGKNQHLYQRIKRITDMKTNYMNAKQQIFILTFAIATIASLAWMSPAKKEKTEKVQQKNTVAAISPSIAEIKSIKEEQFAKADTDTTKKRRPRMIFRDKNGTEVIYTSLDDMPDSLRKRVEEMEKKFSSPEWKAKMAKIELNSKEMEKKFNSPEWKEKMAKIELNSKEMEKKFNSPEWKEKMAKIELNSKEMEKKFNSPEWKEKMAKIQLNAEQMEKKFNSPEWKEKMAKIQLNAEQMEKKFNSPEWKEKMAKIQLNAEQMEKKFNSPEWKEKMAKIQLNAEQMEKKFNSPEWKEKMAKIELNSKALEKKFNSPEWKQKMEDIKKLQDSPEYKELQEKFEKDLDELKKKKGIKNDKSFFYFENNKEGLKSVLPSTTAFDATFASAPKLNFKSSVFESAQK